MNNQIRLPEETIIAIIKTFKASFPRADHLWVFGSRTNLKEKGGDIDLYIETTLKNIDDSYSAKMNFSRELQMIIGEQKVDIVINRNNGIDLPIYNVAKKEGIKLV